MSLKKKKQPFRRQFPSTEQCEFVKASDWFINNVSSEDHVVAKINAEGAEIEILDDLFDTEEYKKINHLFVLFDVGKIKGKVHLKDKMLKKLDVSGVSYITLDHIKTLVRAGVLKNTQKARIIYWLNSIKDV